MSVMKLLVLAAAIALTACTSSYVLVVLPGSTRADLRFRAQLSARQQRPAGVTQVEVWRCEVELDGIEVVGESPLWAFRRVDDEAKLGGFTYGVVPPGYETIVAAEELDTGCHLITGAPHETYFTIDTGGTVLGLDAETLEVRPLLAP